MKFRFCLTVWATLLETRRVMLPGNILVPELASSFARKQKIEDEGDIAVFSLLQFFVSVS